MNLIELHITKLLSEPYEAYGKWFVKVAVEAYGVTHVTNAMLQTKEEAEKLKVGDVIQG